MRFSSGAEVSGVVREWVQNERISFSYGYVSGTPFGPGATNVTIECSEAPMGTMLHLRHVFHDKPSRDAHVMGWRQALARLARMASDETYAGVDALVDGWFDAFNERSELVRADKLEPIVVPDVSLSDARALTLGLTELVEHVGALQSEFKGVRIERTGPIRRAHGIALADYAAHAEDGRLLFRCTNVFELDGRGRIAHVVGLPSVVDASAPPT